MLHRLKQTAGGLVKLKEIEALSAEELQQYLQKNHSAVGGAAAAQPTAPARPMSALTPRGNKQRALAKARLVAAEREALREARDYTDLCFEAENRLGLRANKMLLASARQFDERQRQRTGATQEHLATLRFDPESRPSGTGFGVNLREVFWNRFTTNEKPEMATAATPRKPVRVHRFHKPWTLEESQWVPRRDTGNSNDFFETPNALHQMLRTDWEMARSHHMLAFVICKAQLSTEEMRERQINEERAVHEPCVEAVHDVLKRHVIVLYNAFDHYALLDKKPKKGDVLNTAEIFYVKTPQYYAFTLECELEDRANLPISMIETIFSIVDARDGSTITRDVHNIRQGLSRHEWLQVLVRLAMRKFGRVTNTHDVHCTNVAVAVERLFAENLLPKLPRVCLMNHNEFRTTFCYHEGVDSVLKSQRASLTMLYSVYAAAGNSGKSNEQELIDSRRMSLGEWLTCLQHVGLFELGLISHTAAMQAFSWSRIRSSKGWTNAEEIRMRHLTYEDFCEALVRIASICALPTVEEVEAAQAANAGEFLLSLYVDAPEAFHQFVACRTGEWGKAPFQRMHKCLMHLLHLIWRVVQANYAESPDRTLPKGPVTKGTLETFFRRRHSAPRLALPRGLLGASLVREAMRRVEESTFLALRSVLAFSCLSDDDIRTLHSNLGVAKYVDGEYVFEQGDEGDVFYLITAGEAEVLHYDPSDPLKEETLLNVLSVADCFGETALLKRAPRNASVMAKGDLHVAYIAKPRFESALGRSLADMRLAHTDKEALQKEQAAREQEKVVEEEAFTGSAAAEEALAPAAAEVGGEP